MGLSEKHRLKVWLDDSYSFCADCLGQLVSRGSSESVPAEKPWSTKEQKVKRELDLQIVIRMWFWSGSEEAKREVRDEKHSRQGSKMSEESRLIQVLRIQAVRTRLLEAGSKEQNKETRELEAFVKENKKSATMTSTRKRRKRRSWRENSFRKQEEQKDPRTSGEARLINEETAVREHPKKNEQKEQKSTRERERQWLKKLAFRFGAQVHTCSWEESWLTCNSSVNDKVFSRRMEFEGQVAQQSWTSSYFLR